MPLSALGSGDERASAVTTATAVTLGAPAGANWLAKRGTNHATHLLALLGCHEDWVKTLGYDHSIGERVNRRGRVGGNPLLVFRRQAVAEPHAEVIQ